MESTTGYTFAPFVRYFTSERLIMAHGKKEPAAFSVTFERHWQSGKSKLQKFPNGLSGIRTREPSIVSRVLQPLSHRAPLDYTG